jgi:flagellar motor switch protein FliM
MDFVAVAHRTTFAVIAEISLRVLERGGKMYVVIPQGALNPIKESLARDISNELPMPDPRWARQIQNEVGRTEVVVQGVIEERNFTLADIANLQVGQVLRLQATADSRVKLECNSQALFWCQMGQGDGHYTLRVEGCVDEEQEFIDDILFR